MLRAGELNDREIELQVKDSGAGALPTFEIPGMPGASMGMINLNEMLGQAFGGKTKPRRMTVTDSYKVLMAEESDKLLDPEAMRNEAVSAVEQNGIVFIDEIDKICGRAENRGGADVSREGVQRDLLPLIEGTTVSTKHGPVKTDHVLFIASGAFHMAKPADLLPELQGRLPIRVELKALTRDDFKRILTEPEASLTKQYRALPEDRGRDAELRRRRHRCAGGPVGRDQFSGGEYRRPAPAHGDGTPAGGNQLQCHRPPRHHHHHRRRLCERTRRAAGEERGSEPVYPVAES
jgi:ATP-dependent HslUV protease ATP-binding subunit HslU